MKKYILSILAAMLIILTGCTKTVMVPVYYMPPVPEVLLQQPHVTQVIEEPK